MTKPAQTLNQKRTEELPNIPCRGRLSICTESQQTTTGGAACYNGFECK